MRLSLYTVFALSAVLVYFHLECLKEKKENVKYKTNPEFKPADTDCFVPLSFIKKGKDIEMKIGEMQDNINYRLFLTLRFLNCDIKMGKAIWRNSSAK